MKRFLFYLLLLMLTTAAACQGNDASRPRPSQTTPPAVATGTETAANTSVGRPKIVAFGDSLTAGLGLPAHQSYPSLLQEMLERDGYSYEVVNAGVSGDTSAGGLRRLDWALAEGEVRFLILELGANDLLRGQPVAEMKKNLSQMIERAQARRAQVILAGMYAPTNTGAIYQKEVAEAFQSLAREHDVKLIPFFLDRVAGVENLNLEDGIHPNAAGTKIVAETVYQTLKPLLVEAGAHRSSAP